MYKLIGNSIDLSDYLILLKEYDYPYHIVAKRARSDDLKWNEINAFFHVGIVGLYSSLTGMIRDEAKDDLQIRFAPIEEHEDYYLVESVSGMSKERLVLFIQECQTHMIKQFGTKANEQYIYPKTKKITKKEKVMKWKINDEWSISSDSYNLKLERTVLNTAKGAKNKYVTTNEGFFPSLEAIYKKMVNTVILDDPNILGNLKTMVDLMDRLASDIAVKYPKKEML